MIFTSLSGPKLYSADVVTATAVVIGDDDSVVAVAEGVVATVVVCPRSFVIILPFPFMIRLCASNRQYSPCER